jgi:hypothetical protein
MKQITCWTQNFTLEQFPSRFQRNIKSRNFWGVLNSSEMESITSRRGRDCYYTSQEITFVYYIFCPMCSGWNNALFLMNIKSKASNMSRRMSHTSPQENEYDPCILTMHRYRWLHNITVFVQERIAFRSCINCVGNKFVLWKLIFL